MDLHMICLGDNNIEFPHQIEMLNLSTKKSSVSNHIWNPKAQVENVIELTVEKHNGSLRNTVDQETLLQVLFANLTEFDFDTVLVFNPYVYRDKHLTLAAFAVNGPVFKRGIYVTEIFSIKNADVERVLNTNKVKDVLDT